MMSGLHRIHRGASRWLAIVLWIASGFMFGVFLSDASSGGSEIKRQFHDALTIVDHTAITQQGQRLQFTERDLLESHLVLDAPTPGALRVGPGRAVFEVDIKKRDLKKLLYKRSVAERDEILFLDPDSYVPAKITFEGERYSVWMRLKGDLIDHFREGMWSFRVKVRKDKTILGQRKFSFQMPDTRNFLGEWVFYRAYRQEGGIAPRYAFVEVYVNGVSRGIYAMEEHFDKLLIENNRRREGPIIKVDESAMFGRRHGGDPWSAFKWVSFEAFQLSKIDKSETLRREFRVAISLIEGYRRGIYDAKDLFDIDLFAKYIALSDLMGTWHSLRYHNLRFYYNGITGKLEPIAFDGSSVGKKLKEVAYSSMVGSYNEEFYRLLWNSPKMVERYFHYLEVFSSDQFLKALWEEIGDEVARNEEILQMDYPVYKFPLENLYENQKVMRSFLASREAS